MNSDQGTISKQLLEARLQEAQEVANLGFYVLDIVTNRFTSSAVLDRIFGIPADYEKSIDGWAGLLHPEDRQETLRYFRKVVEDKTPFDREYRLVRFGDGEVRWLHGLGRIQFNRDGQPVSMLGTVQDITERKLAEEALQSARQELELRVKERTAELSQANAHLKHLLQSSDHERQLIAYEIHDGLAQQMAAALMQFQAFEHLRESQPEHAAEAYEAGMTMLRQGHFEARRLIDGVRPPILDEAGVAEAISHLVHEQSRGTGQKIDLHTRVAFDRLDPTLENAIYRIAQEGLTNASKYSKSAMVRVRLLQRGDRLRIEIRDWGKGFDPKSVPKSHFGLEGIRQRAKLLGGKCSIRSTAGKGACIMVELPVVPRDEGE